MKLALQFYFNEDIFGLNFMNWYWRICHVKHDYNRDVWHAFGFSFGEKALHLRWGYKNKVIWMPWDYGSNIRYQVQNEKGDFVMAKSHMEGIAYKALRKAGVKDVWKCNLTVEDSRKIYKDEYKYSLKNGETQVRTATYHVEEREWRWRIFHPFAIGPKKVQRSISVEFSDEVGEETGSWKGGCTGCGYEMNPGETPFQTLKRMERDRKF